jgi:hypothetical protein
VIRPHPAMASPAHEAIHDPVLPLLFQPADRLSNLSLWMENERRN